MNLSVNNVIIILNLHRDRVELEQGKTSTKFMLGGSSKGEVLTLSKKKEQIPPALMLTFPYTWKKYISTH